MKRFLILLVVLGVSVTSAQDQLLNLPSSSGSRINVDDYTGWPFSHGDAQVCLWPGDKTAAFTLTIDDNNDQDISFWLDMKKKYEFTATWFIIVNNVNAWGLWDLLVTRGNDVQSHTRSHMSSGTDAQLRTEYGGSRSDIDRMMKNGHRCHTLAYPNGTVHDVLARDYFIGARGTYGVMNNAANINYMNVNSGGLNDKSRIDVLLDPAQKLYNKSYHRGWLSVHYHNVTDKAATESYLAYIDSKKDEIWAASFTDVCMYGQSRDSHTLTMGAVSSSSISFTLSDRMADSVFTYPLTVKVRVNNDWTGVLAMQDGVQRLAYTVEHEGNTYALVDAVPDAGEVVLTKAVSGIIPFNRLQNNNAVAPGLYGLDGRLVDNTAVTPGMYLVKDENGMIAVKLIIP